MSQSVDDEGGGGGSIGSGGIGSICFISSLFVSDIDKLDKPGFFDKDPRFEYLLFTNLDNKE